MLLALNKCETLYKGVLSSYVKGGERMEERKTKQYLCVEENKRAMWLKNSRKEG